ncbi:hypothetical protein [Maioricimonas sp. JC845]|uniref:hypothetical protein n=1 Tax=Maioricimonas sp. JC845 TaxID=3232138 RepID=UPI0034597441
MKSLSALFVCAALAAPLTAGAADPIDPSDGIIRVEVRGVLNGVSTRENDAGSPEFVHASVIAGHQRLNIDPSGSHQALSQLLYWSVPRHGDFRQMYIHVTGRLEFRDERPDVEIGGRQEKGPWPCVVAEEVRIAPLYLREVKRFMAGDLELPEKP